MQRLTPDRANPVAPGPAAGPSSRLPSPSWQHPLRRPALTASTRGPRQVLTHLLTSHDAPRPAGTTQSGPCSPSLVPSHATCLYLPPRSHHTKLLQFPGQTLLFPFCTLLRALPLPTGLGEGQMPPPWRTFAGSSAPDSYTCASPGIALTGCNYLFDVLCVRP